MRLWDVSLRTRRIIAWLLLVALLSTAGSYYLELRFFGAEDKRVFVAVLCLAVAFYALGGAAPEKLNDGQDTDKIPPA